LAKLTDKEKKKIIADYIETQNFSETGRMNNVSDMTVRRLVESNEDVLKKVEEKKKENTRDILEYMDNIYEKQKKIIDLSLEALIDKLSKPDMFTNVKDIATVYGVIFDKALKYKEMQKNNKNSVDIQRVQIINDLGDLDEDKS
jgi:DNA-directed RNA polymerase specialized sigma subunit